jgi:hypothetical protein
MKNSTANNLLPFLVVSNDLTKENVDAIVNAANSWLKHRGGVWQYFYFVCHWLFTLFMFILWEIQYFFIHFIDTA